MKYVFVVLFFFSLQASAQWKNYTLSPKGDTLNRIDMKGLRQGPWVVSVPDLRGERGYEEEGYFVDDQKEGTWRRFSLEGDLIAVENYRWGHKHGKNHYFNYQGEPVRIESWKAIDPKNPYDTVAVRDVNDPTKITGYKVVKVESASVKHGDWRYYDPFTGRVEKTEKWVMDRLKTDDEEDELAPIDVSQGTTKKAEEKKPVTKPKEVLEFEKKNAGKKKIKVRTGSTGG